MQLAIDWTAESTRANLLQCDLGDHEIDLCLLIGRRGAKRQVGQQLIIELAISKRVAAKDMRCSPNTVTAAANRLKARGVLLIVESARRAPPIYLLSLDRLSQLDRRSDQIANLAQVEANWSGVVSATRVRENDSSHSRDRVRVPVDTGGLLTTLDHPHPWGQLTDRHLDLLADDESARRLLNRLWQGARESPRPPSWLRHTDHETMRKFAALVHYCWTTRLGPAPAGSSTANRRVAILTARVKRGEFTRLNQQNWDWSAAILRRSDCVLATIEEPVGLRPSASVPRDAVRSGIGSGTAQAVRSGIGSGTAQAVRCIS